MSDVTFATLHYLFAIGLAADRILAKKYENFLALRHGEICRARSPKLWQQQWLSSSRRLPVTAGLVTTVIAHYLANCVYSCLCWVVKECDLMFSVILIWDIFDVPWRAALKRPACWQNCSKSAKCMETNANDRQNVVFYQNMAEVIHL